MLTKEKQTIVDEVRVRSAIRNDVWSCLELLKEEEFRFPDGSFPDFDYLAEFLEDNLFLVAEFNGAIVGCIFGEALKASVVMIWYFVVHPDHRKQGIGGSLYNEFEKLSISKQLGWSLLYTAITNKEAREFYLKKGYSSSDKAYFELEKKL